MKRKLYALIFAAGFTGLALTAWAQAPGRGMHDPLAVPQEIQAKLNLNTSQQQQWDAAIAQSKAAHDAIRANFQQLKAATQAELAKSDPDLAALASLSDQSQQHKSYECTEHADEHRQARNWDDAQRRCEIAQLFVALGDCPVRFAV